MSDTGSLSIVFHSTLNQTGAAVYYPASKPNKLHTTFTSLTAAGTHNKVKAGSLIVVCTLALIKSFILDNSFGVQDRAIYVFSFTLFTIHTKFRFDHCLHSIVVIAVASWLNEAGGDALLDA